MEIIANIFEESVEIFFDDSKLSPEEVTPLDEHVVEGNKSVVEFSQAIRFGDAVEYLS